MVSAAASSRPPCACTTLRRVARVLARSYDAALAASGMNVTQYAVLRAIARHPGESLRQMAEDLSLDRTSFYRALAPLQRRRWITVGAGPDARSRSAALSPRGAAALAAAAGPWAKIQDAAVHSFGGAAFARLTAELDRLRACVEQLDLPPAARA